MIEECPICRERSAEKAIADVSGVSEIIGSVCEPCFTNHVRPLFIGGFETIHRSRHQKLKRKYEREWTVFGSCPECGIVQDENVNRAPPTPSTCGNCGIVLQRTWEQSSR